MQAVRPRFVRGRKVRFTAGRDDTVTFQRIPPQDRAAWVALMAEQLLSVAEEGVRVGKVFSEKFGANEYFVLATLGSQGTRSVTVKLEQVWRSGGGAAGPELDISSLFSSPDGKRTHIVVPLEHVNAVSLNIAPDGDKAAGPSPRVD